MTNNLIKDNIQLDSTKLTRDGADGYSSALFELHLQLHSQVVNPYTFNPKQNYNSYSTLKESYNYDGVYGPIPDENGFVDLTDYASLYIPDYTTVTSIPEENQKYLDSGILPTNMTRCFSKLSNVSSINISNLNTSYVVSFQNTFNINPTNGKNNSNGILSEIIGIESINTSSCIDMSGMFYYTDLKNLNLSNWDVSKVETMSNMFANTTLENIILNWSNMNSITTVESMFFGTTITNLVIDGWDEIKTISHLFDGCDRIKSFTFNIHGNTLTDISYAFNDIELMDFEILDLNNLDVSNVTNASFVFHGRGRDFDGRYPDGMLINEVNIVSWKTPKVTNFEMFCRPFNSMKLYANLDLSSCTNGKWLVNGNERAYISGEIHFYNVPNRSIDKWENAVYSDGTPIPTIEDYLCPNPVVHTPGNNLFDDGYAFIDNYIEVVE